MAINNTGIMWSTGSFFSGCSSVFNPENHPISYYALKLSYLNGAHLQIHDDELHMQEININNLPVVHGLIISKYYHSITNMFMV